MLHCMTSCKGVLGHGTGVDMVQARGSRVAGAAAQMDHCLLAVCHVPFARGCGFGNALEGESVPLCAVLQNNRLPY